MRLEHYECSTCGSRTVVARGVANPVRWELSCAHGHLIHPDASILTWGDDETPARRLTPDASDGPQRWLTGFPFNSTRR